MKFKRILAVAIAVSLGTVLLSHAAERVPSDSSKTMARSERIGKEAVLRTNHTGYMVKDITDHEVRLYVNKEPEIDYTLEHPGMSPLHRRSSDYKGWTALVPFVFSAQVADAPAFPWAERPSDAGQASETDIGSDLRHLAHTLRDTANRRDLEIKTLLREWAIGRDEDLIQRQRTFVQKLRAVAEAAEVRARAIESDIAE